MPTSSSISRKAYTTSVCSKQCTILRHMKDHSLQAHRLPSSLRRVGPLPVCLSPTGRLNETRMSPAPCCMYTFLPTCCPAACFCVSSKKVPTTLLRWTLPNWHLQPNTIARVLIRPLPILQAMLPTAFAKGKHNRTNTAMHTAATLVLTDSASASSPRYANV